MPTFNPIPISSLTLLAAAAADDVLPIYDEDEVNVQLKTKGIKYSNLIPLGLDTLADPNADRVLYWNNTNNSLAWLTLPADMSIVGGVLKQKHMLYNTVIPNGTAISPRLAKMIITAELNGCTLDNVYLASFTAVSSTVSVSIKKNGSVLAATSSIASGAKTGNSVGNATTFASNDEVWIDCTSGSGGDGLDVVLVFKK